MFGHLIPPIAPLALFNLVTYSIKHVSSIPRRFHGVTEPFETLRWGELYMLSLTGCMHVLICLHL
jgi:hypothetical protein